MKFSLFNMHSIACYLVGTPGSGFGPSGEEDKEEFEVHQN